MKRIITTVFLLFTFYLPLTCHAQLEEPYPGGDECTIGVASGKATMDGRPLLWKSRDYASEPDNEVVYNMSSVNRYIAVTNAGETYVWMGVNDKGFSIVNSLCNDLQKAPYGPSNGQLMYDALSTCNSVDDFEQMLIITNESGRQTGANFAVIDASGAAAVFETAGYEYWKFDACDSVTAPDGYLLRTNFAFMGDGKNGIRDGLYSVERYRRQQQLIDNFHAGDTLNAKSIFRTQMRDFSDFDSQPVGVPFPYKWLSNRPYGYIYCGVSICRSTTVSAAVIQGVLPEESPKLSTMWTMLGQPASSITVPYWPAGRT
ncbi:MAG: carcinine hydrolase/isopenicillin-N N-acyltransferase family protein, partial [candidate division KSB1 bacterium]|nr:carcinine hydrolase/isopenicillin-N N-acyltransferase family protein [candidate division KSB1 bacterium]